MFKNIGGKIKKYAVIMCWVGIVFSVALGALQIYIGITGAQILQNLNLEAVLSQMTSGQMNSSAAQASADKAAAITGGVVTMVVGFFLSWTGSFLTYGFGDMVENSAIRAALLLKKEMDR